MYLLEVHYRWSVCVCVCLCVQEEEKEETEPVSLATCLGLMHQIKVVFFPDAIIGLVTVAS